MLRLTCPFCGERNHDEFTYLEDATPKPKFDNARMSDWLDAIYWRVNPKGKHQELWHHVGGCRMILRVERDTVTHEIFKIEPAHPGMNSMLGLSESKPKSKPKTSKRGQGR